MKSTTADADCVVGMQPSLEMRLLKVEIAKRVGRAADELKFLLGREELPGDDLSPQDCGIKKGSTIIAVLKSEG